MGRFMQMLERWAGGGPGGEKRLNSFRWLLVIGLIGVLIMIINTFVTVKDVAPPTGQTISSKQEQPVILGKNKEHSLFEDYEQMYESRLKDILEKIVGVGDVEVLVTIDSTEETVVKSNISDSRQRTEEKDTNGANRAITEVTRSGEVVLHEVSGDQVPIVLKIIKPKIRGVIVVAKGAENVLVKKIIVEAVTRGLDVPAHHVSILPRKQ